MKSLFKSVGKGKFFSSKSPEAKLEKICRETNDIDKLELLIPKSGQGKLPLETLADLRFSDGWTPLQVCCFKGFKETAEHLLAFGKVSVEAIIESDGSNALCKACLHGDLALVQMLIRHGANVDAQTLMKNTPLHYSCWDRKYDVVSALLNAGADINKCNVDGYQPILAAVFHGQAQICKLLIESGADLTARDINGIPLLSMASEKNHLEVVETIISFAAGPNSDGKRQTISKLLLENDPQGRRPVDCSADQRIVQVLQAAMARIDVKDVSFENDSSPVPSVTIHSDEKDRNSLDIPVVKVEANDAVMISDPPAVQQIALPAHKIMFLQALFRSFGHAKFKSFAYAFYSWRQQVGGHWDCDWKDKYATDGELLQLLCGAPKPSPMVSPTRSPIRQSFRSPPPSVTPPPAPLSECSLNEDSAVGHEADSETDNTGDDVELGNGGTAYSPIYQDEHSIDMDARSEPDSLCSGVSFSPFGTSTPGSAVKQRGMSRKQFLALDLITKNWNNLQSIFFLYTHDTKYMLSNSGLSGNSIRAKVVSQDGIWRLFRDWGVSPDIVGKPRVNELLLSCIPPAVSNSSAVTLVDVNGTADNSTSSGAALMTPTKLSSAAMLRRLSASITPPPNRSPVSKMQGSRSQSPFKGAEKLALPAHLQSIPSTLNTGAITANLGSNRSDSKTLYSFQAFMKVRIARNQLNFTVIFILTLHSYLPPLAAPISHFDRPFKLSGKAAAITFTRIGIKTVPSSVENGYIFWSGKSLQ